MEPMRFGASVRQLRQQIGMTQRQLAREVAPYLDERDISHIESGRCGLLAPKQLERLLIALGKDLETFLRPQHARSGAYGYRPNPHTRLSASIPSSGWGADSSLQSALERLRIARQASEEAYGQASRLLDESRQLTASWGRAD